MHLRYLSGYMLSIQRLIQKTIFNVRSVHYITHECNKSGNGSGMKLCNIDTNKQKTQTKVPPHCVYHDSSICCHWYLKSWVMLALCVIRNWPNQQKHVQSISTWIKCFHLWKVTTRSAIISVQARTEITLVFIPNSDRIRVTNIFPAGCNMILTCYTFSEKDTNSSRWKSLHVLSESRQSQCAAIQDCQRGCRGGEPCF